MDWITEILHSEDNYFRFTQILQIVPFLLLLVFFTVILHSIYVYLKFYNIFRRIPGPTRHPILGNLDRHMPTEEGIVNTQKYTLDNPSEKVISFTFGPFLHFIRFCYPEEVGELLCMKPNELPKNKMLHGILKQYLGDGYQILTNGSLEEG